MRKEASTRANPTTATIGTTSSVTYPFLNKEAAENRDVDDANLHKYKSYSHHSFIIIKATMNK